MAAKKSKKPKKAKPVAQYDEAIGPAREPRPDKALRERICTWVRDGVKPLRAAVVEGATEDEFNEWMRAGRAGQRHSCEQLALELERAEAYAEATVIGRIKLAAKEDWKAASWLAERNWPERYQRKSIQGDDAPRSPAHVRPDDDPFTELDNVVDMGTRRGQGSR